MLPQIILFGAGEIGRIALDYFHNKKRIVSLFVDNDNNKVNHKIADVPVISVNDFLQIEERYELYITCNKKNRTQIEMQLKDLGINDYNIFRPNRDRSGWALLNREIIYSYTQKSNREDVILNHVLHDVSNIFYIDVGSNDPVAYSVTKLFYDKGGSGINIDPQPVMIKISEHERPRDINLCVGVGRRFTKQTLYIQGDVLGGLSTLDKNNVIDDDYEEIEIDIWPLKAICDKYMPRDKEIHFLKIDVEGGEKDVILGADFNKYRPWIVLIESTVPATDIPVYEEWESNLINCGYKFVYSYGVNRYYVAKEKSELASRFLPYEKIVEKYRIFDVKPL